MTHDYPDGNVETPDAGSQVSRRIADELHWTRITRKLSVEDVSHALKIRTAYIEAMEGNRFEDLPAPVYISGFLRTYANYLGLDGEQLVIWLKDENRQAFEPREMELPVPISDIRRPTRPIILVSLIVAIGIAVAWYVYQESRSIDIDLIPEVPDLISDQLKKEDITETAPAPQQAAEAVDEPTTAAVPEEPLPDTAEAAAASPDGDQQAGDAAVPREAEQVIGETQVPQQEEQSVTDTADQQQVEQAVADTAIPPEAEVLDAGDAAVAQEQVIEEAAVPEEEENGDAQPATDAAVLGNADSRIEPSVYGEPGAGSRIELRAVEETWIQVDVPGGTVILTHILLPGDVYHVPDRDDLTLDTGNAGGLEIRVDGILIPVLGGAGAVVRDIPLAADSLKAR